MPLIALKDDARRNAKLTSCDAMERNVEELSYSLDWLMLCTQTSQQMSLDSAERVSGGTQKGITEQKLFIPIIIQEVVVRHNFIVVIAPKMKLIR